ncbi:MAG: OmpA family protein [Bacteroides sp.]|nr:OmpA family protein [Bacteroides sp.]MCM1085304.1 OmpA family protein [Bacteroides sp.]
MKTETSVFFKTLLLGGLLCVLAKFLPLRAQASCQPDPGNLRRAEFHYEKAMTAYREGLHTAVRKYLQIAKKTEPCFAKTYMLEAVVYEDEKKNDSAIKAYEKALAIDPDVFPNAYYSLARLQATSGRYAEADDNLRTYLAYPNISKAMREKAQLLQLRNEEALDLAKDAVPFQPRNLGANINTEYEEYLPFVTVDDQMMIFTRRYMRPTDPPVLEEDFFYSLRDTNGAWQMAQRMEEPINSDDNEGALSISPDGRYLFFAGCNRPDGWGSCDIYASIKRDYGWSKPFNIGKPVNTSHWESQPCLSSDGRTLYFTGTRPGGFGKSDLWRSRLMQGGVWSEPENLGPNINTSGDENSPFLHPDGKTLYFASNGHGGMGGMDLFVSRMDSNGNWSAPQNLGYPINTSADETTLSVNARGDTAYFSSDNLGGFGKKDIYSFPLYEQARPTTVSFMRGFVADAKTHTPLAAHFELISLKTGITRVSSTATAKTGEFLVCLPVDEPFALNVSCSGYLFHSEHIALDYGNASKPMEKEIWLQPIEKGTHIVLENIFYQTDKYQLEKSSTGELERLFLFLAQNPGVRIEISGHTDNVGSAQYNKTLSENRAKAVADYLTNKGIDPARIVAVGYGFDKPVADNQSEEGRAKNRRTELKIL